mmetsp:Transcript_4364/g.8742  ORF Transcript_4364/g.8742 Transcript_4364/m.8742 type:complete len:319 (-) Transcript_4364:83-1039(-)
MIAVSLTFLLYALIIKLGAGDIHMKLIDAVPESSLRCNQSRSIVVASRFWAHTPSDLRRLNGFIRDTEEAVRGRLCVLLVAINNAEDQQQTDAHLRDMGQAFPRLESWGVNPWTITTPLNAMLERARKLGAKYILYLSVEVHLDEEHLDALLHVMDDSTFVAGVALPGHRKMEKLRSPSSQSIKLRCGDTISSSLEGDTIPWNTLAIWRTDELARVGFLKDADRQKPPGMEEAVPIALLQQMIKEDGPRNAKLIHFEGGYQPNWNIKFESAARMRKQAQKMASKRFRTTQQLNNAGVQGEVNHLFYCLNNASSTGALR